MTETTPPLIPQRTTAAWQAADAAHFLHPCTDFQSLARKGSRIITRADNIYVWDSEGHKLLDAMSCLLYTSRKYVEAVRLAGALPLVVPRLEPDEIEGALDGAHGVLRCV